MGRSRQTAVRAAHIIEARRRRDAQYAAGTLHLAAFEALDFERGEVCGRHRSDAAKAQSGAVRGVERLETAVDFAQSVDLEKKDEVQDDAVGCDGTGDRIDRHGAKGVPISASPREARRRSSVAVNARASAPPRHVSSPT